MAPGFPREALAMKVNQMSSPAVHEFGKQRELVLVKETETALDAFLKIVERKVNGLGVVSFRVVGKSSCSYSYSLRSQLRANLLGTSAQLT